MPTTARQPGRPGAPRHRGCALLVATLAGSPLALATAQTPIVFLDPVAGIDQPGGGGSANPLRSLTFAAARTAPGPVILRLRPGIYGAPNETFPIALPAQCTLEADPALTPAGSERVVIDGQPLQLSTMLLVNGGSGAVDLTLRNLVVGGAIYRGVQVNGPAGTGTVRLQVDDCRFRSSRELAILVDGDTTATIAIARCRFDGIETPLRITAAGSSFVDLRVDRTRFLGGMTAIELTADGGTIATTLRRVLVADAQRHGIAVATPNQGLSLLRAEHCTFAGNGLRVIGGTSGAIHEVAAATAGLRTFALENCIFANNRSDAAAATPLTWTFGNNLVSQPGLAGMGGNLLATPQFVDAAADDLHLRPGSPGVDAGVAAAVTLPQDLDGDPLPTTPDLGADEVHDRYLYVHGPARVGGPLPGGATVRALGAPGAVFFAAAMLGTAPPQAWGPGVIHLVPPWFGPLFVGALDATGVGAVPLPLPADPSLVGVEFTLQGVFSTPPFLGSNPFRLVLAR